MNRIDATIIIPTHNHGRLLQYSVNSALKQTVQNIEIFIVGDGATQETKQVALSLCQQDPRIQFFSFAKTPRTGEEYRKKLLEEKARGKIVCYLCDDDLWLPNHIEIVKKALTKYDFASTHALTILDKRNTKIYFGDLSKKRYKKLLLLGENRIPLSCAAHTYKSYMKLPYGWRNTPAETPTDLYMFQQFLNDPSCTFNSIFKVTVLHFPSPNRVNHTLEQRELELKSAYKQINELHTIGNNLQHTIKNTIQQNIAAEKKRVKKRLSKLRSTIE